MMMLRRVGGVGVGARTCMTRTACRAISVVPQFDLKRYFDGDEKEKQKLANEVNEACEHIGFLTIVGHGVSEEAVNSMNKVTRDYFDLPVAEKRKIPMTDDYPYGYNGYQEENLSKGFGEDGLKDLKECFAIGTSNPKAGQQPVKWPEQPEEFRRIWSMYYSQMESLSKSMMRVFALALNMPERWFDDKFTYHRSALRALNYPPLAPDAKFPEAQMRAGAHTDYGALTILLQDECGGLQVRDRKGQWCDVAYVPNSYVLNLGDLMARWTNDKWVSTLHRVKPTIPRRQSIAYFSNVNHDYMVSCIPTCTSPTNPPKYEPILAWDHLMEKHLSSVKY